MVRAKASAPNEAFSKGDQYAKDIIFYAGKSKLIRQSGLRRIGKSGNFSNLIEAVAKEEPKSMRIILKKADAACTEGETRSAAQRTERKRAIDAYIEKYGKRQRRNESPTAETRGDGSSSRAESPTTRDKNRPNLLATTDIDNWIQAQAFREKGTEDTQADNEEEEEDDDDNSDKDSCEDTEAEATDEPEPPSKFERQRALVRGEPLRIDDIECRKHIAIRHTNRVFDIDAEWQTVLDKIIMLLNPEPLQDDVVEFLDNRTRTARATEWPTVSKTSTPEAILNALNSFHRISEDIEIRCAAAQVMLYIAVQRQCPRGQHMDFLRGLAGKAAGEVSSKESRKMFKLYEKDYKHGKRWSDIIEIFGGEGIVILLFVAGIGKWIITTDLTAFQRDCLVHASRHLYSITKLVNVIGPNALETYCSRGCLSKATVDEIAGIENILAE